MASAWLEGITQKGFVGRSFSHDIKTPGKTGF
jgi:hypothetical protein